MQGYAVPASEATVGLRSNVDDGGRMLDLECRAAFSLKQIGIAEAKLATARDELGDLQEQLREGDEELNLIAREKKVAGVGTSPAARSGKGQAKREQHPIIERVDRMKAILEEIGATRELLKNLQLVKNRNRTRAEIRALRAEHELLEAEDKAARAETSWCKPSKVAKKWTRR